jgi:hypothetical protein
MDRKKLIEQYSRYAVAGEGLTGELGGSNWETPPQYTDPKVILDKIWKKWATPKEMAKIAILLEQGIPAESLARTLCFQGFVEGKWTPDVALLISRPVLMMIVALGKKAGVKNMKIRLPQEDDFLSSLAEFVQDPEQIDDMVDEEAEDGKTPLFNLGE